MPETPKKRPAKPFRGSADGVNFTSENQPTNEQKRAGWAKRKQGQELAKLILGLDFKGAKESEIKTKAAEYFGITEDEISVEMIMLFRQAEKAIQKADTQAAKFVIERAHGAAKQEVEQTSVTTIKVEYSDNPPEASTSGTEGNPSAS